MISLKNYAGREQAYVKHVFLANYLERLIHKTASAYDHIAYVDGFAGPWQSAGENYEDTSFGIALKALRGAKASWKRIRGRDVKMSAFLVERDPTAYARLETFAVKYPDVSVKLYKRDFTDAAGDIVKDIPRNAFAFFFIDPKGWRIRLESISTMLRRPQSEVVFNFMFDFINRAASIQQSDIVQGLGELIVHGNWRAELARLEAEADDGRVSEKRKEILVSGFAETLSKAGDFPFVAETTVLRPLMNRPLYCLMYATRHAKGVEVFRDCQIEALRKQSTVRAGAKLRLEQDQTGQNEMFPSLHEMGPDETEKFLANEREAARLTLLANTPEAPAFASYGGLRTTVLTKHVVKVSDVNRIAALLRREGYLAFPDWTARKQVPDEHYRVQKIARDLLSH